MKIRVVQSALVFAFVGLAAVPAFAQDEGAAAAAPAPASVTYALSPSKSWLYVVVYNDPDRWTPVTGHDHAIVATGWSGQVTWNTADASV